METMVVMFFRTAGILPAQAHEAGWKPAVRKTKTSEPDGRAVAAAFRGGEVGAALGEAPDDLAGAEVEARPLGARELVALGFETAERLGRHVLLDPHRLVGLVE